MSRNGSCLHPRHILLYMEQMHDERAAIDYSATSILDCARKIVLQKRIDYYESPDAVVTRFAGESIHHRAHSLLVDEPGYVGEDRVWTELDLTTEAGEVVSFRLSGKPDQRWFETKIVDLKTTAKIPSVANPDHISQVNIYAWMLRDGYDQYGFPLALEISAGEVTYISPNQQRSVTYAVPIWPEERTAEFVRRSLEPYLPWRLNGEYPAILAPYLIPHKNGTATVDRDWRCDYCPLRKECDAIATEERGVAPDSAAYWEREPHLTVAGSGPVILESFGDAGL